jgi:hypothetical protein
VKAQIAEYKDHPALLGWYLNDELNLVWMEELEAHYRWTAAGDPDHVAWAVLYEAPELRSYMKTFDVIGTDPYPINEPYDPETTDGQAAHVGVEVDLSLAGIDSARPLWEVIQAHNLRNYQKTCTGCRTPSAKEERSMAWQAVCRGANGIIYYSFFDIKRNDDVSFAKQWAVLSGVAAEIDSFAPVLLSDEGAAPPVTITGGVSPADGGDAPSWLSARARWAPSTEGDAEGNVFYVFVANDGNGAGKVTFKLDSSVGKIGAGGVEVVSEAPPRKIESLDGRSFVDDIERLDVVVYRFTPAAKEERPPPESQTVGTVAPQHLTTLLFYTCATKEVANQCEESYTMDQAGIANAGFSGNFSTIRAGAERNITTLFSIHDTFFSNGKGMRSDWQASWAALQKQLVPLIESGAVSGFFVGDELFPGKITYADFLTTIKALATMKTKYPHLVTWENEGGTSWVKYFKDGVPAELDIISLDNYYMGTTPQAEADGHRKCPGPL